MGKMVTKPPDCKHGKHPLQGRRLEADRIGLSYHTSLIQRSCSSSLLRFLDCACSWRRGCCSYRTLDSLGVAHSPQFRKVLIQLSRPLHATRPLSRNIPPAMSPGGPGHIQEPSASALYDLSPLMGSLSNVLAGTSHQPGNRLPIIQPASPPNKGAPHASPTSSRPAFFPIARAHPHATAIASSGSSTTESISELTSSSSRDSLPTPPGRNGPTTPQKPARSNRRKHSNKSTGRWSRGGGSSDDTGSDRKPPTSQPVESAQSAARSPQTASKIRQQPSLATNSGSTSQTRFMATTFGGPSGDSRRGVVSPRPKGRGMTQLHSYTTRQV
jgi:hypothetical protein